MKVKHIKGATSGFAFAREPAMAHPGKDIVAEMIFKTANPRYRLMLELMARGGMRVGEVLKLRVKDIEERGLQIESPKSGKQSEIVCIP